MNRFGNAVLGLALVVTAGLVATPPWTVEFLGYDGMPALEGKSLTMPLDRAPLWDPPSEEEALALMESLGSERCLVRVDLARLAPPLAGAWIVAALLILWRGRSRKKPED